MAITDDQLNELSQATEHLLSLSFQDYKREAALRDYRRLANPEVVKQLIGRIRELEGGDGRCLSCHGPHLFDTSVPSPLWNRVIRENGLPEYLCASCVIKAFVQARTSFIAELYGPDVDGEQVPRIAVAVDEIPVTDSYGHLQAANRELQERIRELEAERERILATSHSWESEAQAVRKVLGGRVDITPDIQVANLRERVESLTTQLAEARKEIENQRYLVKTALVAGTKTVADFRSKVVSRCKEAAGDPRTSFNCSARLHALADEIEAMEN